MGAVLTDNSHSLLSLFLCNFVSSSYRLTTVHIINPQNSNNMNAKESNNQNYDECPVGEFFWIGDMLAHWTKQTHY